jgi:ABC-2 type transport system ATP-binding protein
MTKALILNKLNKTYATGTQALTDVSFEIESGAMIALLGANGAGKTTLIGTLTGLVKKTSGEATVFGVDIDKDPETVRSFIGVVPQEFNFSIFEKVLDIIVNQAGYYGMSRPEAHKRAEELLKALDLWEKRDALSRTLSGGMKRRLMIARALIHKPKFLLLDEPSAGVDVELRRGMWDFIRKIHAEGTTILLTTHYIEEAEELCDHIVILKQGSVIRDENTQALLAEQNTQSFILTTNKKLSEGGVYNFKYKSENVYEAIIGEEHSVTDMISDLKKQDITVIDIKPKTNRLEEIFVSVAN